MKCLAFDAVTAARVFSSGRYVRGERLLSAAERGRPFPPDIRSWVVLLARIAGWQPPIRHPLPANEVLWRPYCAAADDGPRRASSQSALAIP